jgi:hypothetical protein
VRDIIWTVILVWLVWKIIDTFKNVSKMQTQRVNNNQQQQYSRRKEGEVKIDSTHTSHKPHFKPEDGEYVDYEEIK